MHIKFDIYNISKKKKKKRIFERVSVFVSKKFMMQRFGASNDFYDHVIARAEASGWVWKCAKDEGNLFYLSILKQLGILNQED